MKATIILFILAISSAAHSSSYVEGCYINTYTTELEKLCIKLKVPARKSRACRSTYTIPNEKVCLKNHKDLTTAMIYDCTKYTSTVSGERECLSQNLDY